MKKKKMNNRTEYFENTDDGDINADTKEFTFVANALFTQIPAGKYLNNGNTVNKIDEIMDKNSSEGVYNKYPVVRNDITEDSFYDLNHTKDYRYITNIMYNKEGNEKGNVNPKKNKSFKDVVKYSDLLLIRK